MNQIHDADAISKFITLGDINDSDMTSNPTDTWVLEEKERLGDFWTLLIELASSRCWSQMVFVNVPPYSLAAVLHTDRQVGQQLLTHQKVMWEAILQAEALVYQQKPNVPKAVMTEVNQRLLDVSLNSFQIAREVCVLCQQCNWDVGEEGIQIMAHQLFGGHCETKYTLEDLFAHLASVQKASHPTRPLNKCLAQKNTVCFSTVLSVFCIYYF